MKATVTWGGGGEERKSREGREGSEGGKVDNGEGGGGGDGEVEVGGYDMFLACMWIHTKISVHASALQLRQFCRHLT